MTEAQAIKALTNWYLGEVDYLEKANGNLKYLFDKTANAGRNNYTKYGYKMHQIQPSNMDYPAYWCDSFMDCGCVEVFGVEKAKELLHGFDDYTVESANNFKRYGQWLGPKALPKAGDFVFFKNSTGICHIGFVYRVANGYIYTVEGNTSSASGVVDNGGAVACKIYKIGYSRIAGFGRPDYSIMADIPCEGDELTMAQYDELKKLINDVSNSVNSLSDKVSLIDKAIGGTMIYGGIDENMPDWAHEAVQWCMDKKIVNGVSESNLNLNEDKLWICCIIYRLSQLIEQQTDCKL